MKIQGRKRREYEEENGWGDEHSKDGLFCRESWREITNFRPDISPAPYLGSSLALHLWRLHSISVSIEAPTLENMVTSIKPSDMLETSQYPLGGLFTWICVYFMVKQSWAVVSMEVISEFKVGTRPILHEHYGSSVLELDPY